MIEFDNASYKDFELRARDIAVFSYVKGKLRIVQNCTINHYMKVSKSWCFLATCLYGPTSEEVAMLRRFRDDILLGSMPLSPLVTVYYHVSPLAVRWLGDNRLFKGVLLVFAKPLVNCIDWYLRKDQRKNTGI